MKQVVIENSIINLPFEGPERHFKFDNEEITDEITGERRRSSHFIPIARARDDTEAKVSTAQTPWVPAVNNAGTWGRRGFVEIGDPWDRKKPIRSVLGKMSS